MIHKFIDGHLRMTKFGEHNRNRKDLSKQVKGSLRRKIYEISKKYDEKYANYFQTILYY